MSRKLLLVPVLLAFMACKKEEPPPSEVTVVPPATPSATEPAPVAEAPIDLEGVAVEEDFEEEAEKEITAANLEKKVAELEKELSTD
jgi:hypothetical protein